MSHSPRFRWADASDYPALAEIMFDAVHRGRSLYTDRQKRAWVSEPRSGDQWTGRLSRQKVIVAEAGGRIVGFMSLADEGYIDFAYIRPEQQGSGLFRQMLERIEDEARRTAQPLLWVHASLMAEPAFSASGFSIVKSELVEIGTESLQRFEMRKPLESLS